MQKTRAEGAALADVRHPCTPDRDTSSLSCAVGEEKFSFTRRGALSYSKNQITMRQINRIKKKQPKFITGAQRPNQEMKTQRNG